MEDKIFKYGKDITWSLPILFQYEPVWGGIVKLFKEYGVEVPKVNGFGCCSMAWTGGRNPYITCELEPRHIHRIFNYCKDVGITPSFTLTNTQITKEELKDKYSNYILDIALEVGAHFIVYSEDLYNHIKEKDPGAYMVASVIKPVKEFQGKNQKNWSVENETNYYNKLLKKYDLVVVRPEYSMEPLLENPSLIDDITRIEVLINQICVPNCPLGPEHYDFMTSVRYGVTQGFDGCLQRSTACALQYKRNFIHNRRTIQKLVNHGVKHLKVQGRSVGNSAKGHAVLLFNSIFNTEGSNWFIFENIIHGKLNKEIEVFESWLNS